MHVEPRFRSLSESCSCSSSCSCSIRGTSAPKREPDPSAIILFHHFDREIRRILEHEHEPIPARPWGTVTNGNIIPFVDPIAANGHVASLSEEDKIWSRLEAAAELMLVAAGAAGVVTALW